MNNNKYRIINRDNDNKYLIFSNYHNESVAEVTINNNDDNNLYIDIKYLDNYIRSEEKYKILINYIIDNICLLYYDKQYIYATINNDNNYEYYSCCLKDVTINDNNFKTYKISNIYNKEFVTKLLEDINNTKYNLANNNISWNEIREFNDIETLVYNNKIELNNIKINNSLCNITFYKDGSMKYESNTNKINYEFIYRIDNYEFKFNSYYIKNGRKKDFISINRNRKFTEIIYGMFSIRFNNREDKKRLCYTTINNNNSSIDTIIWVNKDNIIRDCYIDFIKYRNNGSPKGKYSLRIFSNEKPVYFALDYISRNGNFLEKYPNAIKDEDIDTYNAIMNQEITYKLVNKLIDDISLMINNGKLYNNENINIQNIHINFYGKEKEILRFLNDINKDIPSDYLKTIIDDFTKYYDNEVSKSKQLKK